MTVMYADMYMYMYSAPVILPVMGPLGLIGLEAANVVWSAHHQSAHQIIGLRLEGRSIQGRKKTQ